MLVFCMPIDSSCMNTVILQGCFFVWLVGFFLVFCFVLFFFLYLLSFTLLIVPIEGKAVS